MNANGFFGSGAFVQSVGATLSCGGTLVLQPTFNAAGALDLMQRERVNYLVCWPHQYAQFAAAPNCREDDLKTTASAKIITADLRKLAAQRLAAREAGPKTLPPQRFGSSISALASAIVAPC